MTFLAPVFLVGLAALPVIVWLHRRRQRPAPVDVPSLMFLEGETPDSLAPERVRFDAELIVALLAAALLAVAAAGPAFGGGAAGRRVRVVVDRGPSMEAKAGDGKTAHQRADEAVETIRESLRPADRLEVVEADSLRLDLVSLARVGEAGLRIVVSDRLPSPLPPDAHVVAVGDPNVRNIGIVAADVSTESETPQVFVNLWNDGLGEAEVAILLSVQGIRAEVSNSRLRLPVGSARSVTYPLAKSLDGESSLAIEVSTLDDFAADNRVFLSRQRLRVAFGSHRIKPYPAQYQDAVRRMLDLLLTPAGWRAVPEDDEGQAGYPELCIGFDSKPVHRPFGGVQPCSLYLYPIPAGVQGERVPMGRVPEIPEHDDGIGRDIDPTGCDFTYQPGLLSDKGEKLFDADWCSEDRWRGNNPPPRFLRVEFYPDPLVGHPAPVDHAVWPIFMENVVRAAHGRSGPAGFRIREGLLDPRASRLGRDVAPFDARWLEGVKAEAGAAPRNLRPFAVAAALLAFAALWGAPLVRGRRRVP